MFSFRSVESSIIYKKNNEIIQKNAGSTNNDNRKCNISVKKVHILIF
jgi:hypothetical protein